MNAPTPQDIFNLVKKIGAATKEKRVDWSTTSQETLFQAEIADNFVQIEQLYDHDAEETYYALSIRNGTGRLLDQINSASFYNAFQSVTLDRTYPNDLEEIYNAARWQALKVGDVYRDLLDRL